MEEEGQEAAVGQAIDELRPLKHLAESTASDFLRRQQHKENATLQSGRAAQQERRRRLAAMEKQKREAEELVERYNIKLRNKDEQLVKFLYEDYQRKQREAIIEGRKLQKESESALISEIKKKQQAKEKFYRDQLEILTERLKETEKEEDLILKAHAEEKRKLIREHKQSAKVHISRMKEKLEVDVNDIVFREADARQLSADTVFGYRRA
ncbi:uncharacterized protein EV422DRAFT_154944 [Fimicolochytrium jonesii]|uniref:uncharacterized protein n=1 Tax=Fimicolochytrium jonesii TaxID=1396493 RepID=UPI0022FDD378|nr:uncharacterized protein EV422DRAFT_154944 [Fimicolochytrium jonesii]KAI8826123.1 hypothetical protein EV422DRAFT_154944 [Fimicolochytrium jonesii]